MIFPGLEKLIEEFHFLVQIFHAVWKLETFICPQKAGFSPYHGRFIEFYCQISVCEPSLRQPHNFGSCNSVLFVAKYTGTWLGWIFELRVHLESYVMFTSSVRTVLKCPWINQMFVFKALKTLDLRLWSIKDLKIALYSHYESKFLLLW